MKREELLQAAKPILFNTDMVRAILDGRKTVTRRRPSKRIEDKWFDYTEWVTAVKTPGSTSLTEKEFYEEYPPYHTDDILYVREAWGISNLNYDEKVAYIVYKASENEKYEGCRAVKLPEDKFEKLYDYMAENNPDWRPSIHMPKEAARIFLRVTDVRVERLKDMTDKDALKEGAQGVKCDHAGLGAYGCTDCMNTGWLEPPILEFIGIWESTIKKSDISRYGWCANPWVWVIEFERVTEE